MQIKEQQPLMFGSDPEIFVKDSNDKILPSWKFLPKKDEAKLVIEGEMDSFNFGPTSYKAYTDGFQAETSNAADNCLDRATANIRAGLKKILEAARTHDGGARLTLENTPEIDAEVLKNEKDENVILGCAPSKNVYGMIGEFPGDPRKLLIRFAGGHLHTGFELKHLQAAKAKYERYVRLSDKVLAVYFVGAAEGIDKPLRRRYYGQPGEHRTPAHGLEYRTLSNVWVCHPGVAQLAQVFMRGIVATVDMDMDEAFVCGEELTIDTVMMCDVKAARDIINVNKDMLKAILACGMRHCYTEGRGDLMIQMGLNGIESVIADPEDLEKNWHFNGDWGYGGPYSWQTTTDAFLRHSRPV